MVGSRNDRVEGYRQQRGRAAEDVCRNGLQGFATGTASKLLTTLLTAAESRGIATIFLGTTDKFVGAHRFYEKNGFAEIERHELPDTFPLMAVDTKFYAISLPRKYTR